MEMSVTAARDEMALEDGESETVQQEPARASTRKRWRPDRYGVAG